MTRLQASSFLLTVSLLVAPLLASVCPDKCVCNTRDGLHRATCSSLSELYKFTLRQKHHNINVLDLSHNNITKLSHELDRLTEVVTLDLSTNGITELKKFLNNAKKLVHLNLANNRIQKLSLIHVPPSVSSLDLTNNLLRDVPSNIEHLVALEHLELEGNPIDCSCENIRARDRLLASNVYIDKVRCLTPTYLKGRSWLELKAKDVCKYFQSTINDLDIMMGDQPVDAIDIGEDTSALKSMSENSSSVLDEGHVINGESSIDNDDNNQFLKVTHTTSSTFNNGLEGTGDVESTTIYDFIRSKHMTGLSSKLLASDEMIVADDSHTTTENPLEGSGEGSGFYDVHVGHDEAVTETSTAQAKTTVQDDLIISLYNEDFSSATEGENTTEGSGFYNVHVGYDGVVTETSTVQDDLIISVYNENVSSVMEGENTTEGSGFYNVHVKYDEVVTETSTAQAQTTAYDVLTKKLYNEDFSSAVEGENTTDYLFPTEADSNYDYDEPSETSTPRVEDLNPGPVQRIFDEDENTDNATTEYPIPKPPAVFAGGSVWQNESHSPIITEKPAFTPQFIPDTTISQKVTKELESKPVDNDNQPHKTGTYVCIAIIIVLLVGLIGFAIVKGQMRKRRDRRLLRQQKRDVEKASKEMVDMNKSLLGKPAVVEPPLEKKVNGKYELVPTHESPLKKGENGDAANITKHTNGAATTNDVRTDSPRDTNQNKSSSKDNNLLNGKSSTQDSSFESAVQESPDFRKDSNSLSSEDIFVPVNGNDAPRLNGNVDSGLSESLLNGDQNTDSDFLLPSRDYVPVYSPDMGRVRIKMTETPKPKTPVLVTRSRSNAGDIIITPALDENSRKSTT